jgi:hypothetical protein
MRAKVLSTVLLGLLLMLMPASTSAAQPAVDPTPSPTLGATESPNPNPPGAQDADPDDYTGATWVIGGVVVFVVLVGGMTLLVMRSRRKDESVDR